jgi:hypothetical protein
MALLCPECGFELKPYFLESPEYRPCHVCGFETSALLYPACFAGATVITATDLRREEEDAACFYHESKKAVHSCSQCGRFLCALCSARIGDDVLCPNCIVAGEKGGARGKSVEARLERGRTLYDSLALIVAVLPAMTVSFSIIGGPVATYLAIRYWRRPTSIVRRYAWRKWVALGLGLAETGGWIWLITYLALNRRDLS